ncbi:DUF6235 family protein [Streptomyces bambusae]|uniref:DUF6235 family protein n=1 Tax=Streptomyces bambusae TaxID=1550616 RepID=UPI001CFEB3BA|nr:DUF6235 family protein [Streptomyces bambusae]MCB5165802.1 DUF6235 family protein [Streptomyces bambusae]
MREFVVRAERGAVGFLPVRALISTGATATWPRQARVALKLVAPEDPACAEAADEPDGGPPAGSVQPYDLYRMPYRDWVTATLREVARAWLDQVGPCCVDVVDADLLDEGSKLFFVTLAGLAEEQITVRCPVGDATGPPGPAPAVTSFRERRIERLVAEEGELRGEEADFLYGQAVGYLLAGDGWTAERLLRAVVRQRPTPAVWVKLRAACALLGRPVDAGQPAGPGPSGIPGQRSAPEAGARDGEPRAWQPPAGGPEHATGGPARPADPTGRRPLRLRSGWERLQEWSETAGQIPKNAVHRALFAIAERTVFHAYETYDDPADPLVFFVRVKGSLVLKIRFRDLDTFEIVHVGTLGEAPGIGRGIDRAA